MTFVFVLRQCICVILVHIVLCLSYVQAREWRSTVINRGFARGNKAPWDPRYERGIYQIMRHLVFSSRKTWGICTLSSRTFAHTLRRATNFLSIAKQAKIHERKENWCTPLKTSTQARTKYHFINLCRVLSRTKCFKWKIPSMDLKIGKPSPPPPIILKSRILDEFWMSKISVAPIFRSEFKLIF